MYCFMQYVLLFFAQNFGNDRKSYTKAKETYIEKIIDKAFKQFNVKPIGEKYFM